MKHNMWKGITTLGTLLFTFIVIRDTQAVNWMVLLFAFLIIAKIWD